MKIHSIAFLFLVLFVVRLHADNNQDTLEMSYEPALKSPGVAVGLALGTTIIPIAIGYSTDFDETWWLAASGLVIGPSTGHFYAGQWGRGAITAGLRTGLWATGVYFAGLMWADIFSGSSYAGEALITLASFIGVYGLALYDLYTTEASVDRYNASKSAWGRLNIIPYRDAINKGYGLSFVYNF